MGHALKARFLPWAELAAGCDAARAECGAAACGDGREAARASNLAL